MAISRHRHLMLSYEQLNRLHQNWNLASLSFYNSGGTGISWDLNQKEFFGNCKRYYRLYDYTVTIWNYTTTSRIDIIITGARKKQKGGKP